MTLEEKIKEFLKQPIQVGDFVLIKDENGKFKKDLFIVRDIKKDSQDIYIDSDTIIKSNDYKKYTDLIGEYPFKKVYKLETISTEITGLLYHIGYKYDSLSNNLIKRKNKLFNNSDILVDESNHNSIVEINNEDFIYQRNLTWDLEFKKNLIESIYNDISIGNFVIRNRSYDWVSNRIKNNKFINTTFSEIVDGKQRSNTILEFINNEFSDNNNIYFNEFSHLAKRKFMRFSKFDLFIIDEKTTDEDVLKIFKNINYKSVPQTEEHTNYINTLFENLTTKKENNNEKKTEKETS